MRGSAPLRFARSAAAHRLHVTDTVGRHGSLSVNAAPRHACHRVPVWIPTYWVFVILQNITRGRVPFIVYSIVRQHARPTYIPPPPYTRPRVGVYQHACRRRRREGGRVRQPGRAVVLLFRRPKVLWRPCNASLPYGNTRPRAVRQRCATARALVRERAQSAGHGTRTDATMRTRVPYPRSRSVLRDAVPVAPGGGVLRYMIAAVTARTRAAGFGGGAALS